MKEGGGDATAAGGNWTLPRCRAVGRSVGRSVGFPTSQLHTRRRERNLRRPASASPSLLPPTAAGERQYYTDGLPDLQSLFVNGQAHSQSHALARRRRCAHGVLLPPHYGFFPGDRCRPEAKKRRRPSMRGRVPLTAVAAAIPTAPCAYVRGREGG